MSQDLTTDFERHHSFRFPPEWPEGRELLASLLKGHESFLESIASNGQELAGREATFGLLVHLADRAYEHIAASVVCLSTGNAASAEVTARVALESSVSIRFITRGDRNYLALAWLRDYICHDQKQIAEWEKLIPSMDRNEAEETTPRIATRHFLNKQRSAWVRRFEEEFATLAIIDASVTWPNIAERFRAIGEVSTYRTVYARLSSQTHMDAEDSLNYIVFNALGDEAKTAEMAAETAAVTEFLVAYAVYFYLLAAHDVCRAFDVAPKARLGDSVEYAFRRMHEIGDAWNW